MRKQTKQANDIAINTRVSEDLRAAVERLCRSEGVGMSEAVREAVSVYLALYTAAGNRLLSSLERDAILAQVQAMSGRVREAVEQSDSRHLPMSRRAAVYQKKA
jgi:ADP-dependent phosphofructokinase/glucokinase